MDAINPLTELFPSTTSTAAASTPSELGQEDFLELMVAQLENQDPTKPMDNFEFLSQIAQFGTVDGIQGIQQSFAELSATLSANQTLQAASLVGSKVVTETNIGVLGDAATDAEAETFDVTLEAPANNTSVTLYVQDMSGRLVHTQALDAQPSGGVNIQWDGLDDAGNLSPPGQYRVSAEAYVAGQAVAAPVYAHTRVDSVSIDRANNDVTLNLVGGNRVNLSEVRSFL